MTTYFKVLYDNQAGGEYTGTGTPGFTELTWPGGGRGQIIQDFPDGTTGKLSVALIAGALPTDGQVLTQGAVTADANGAATTLLYPAYMRLDVDITDDAPVAGEKEVDWDPTAPAADGNGIIPTHSLYFDGQTVDLTVGQTLTFSGGQTAELIRVVDQTGADGEIEVRFISNLDAGLPVDGDTFSDEGTGDGTVQGEVHPRTYTPLNLHRLLADLNDDADFAGDDELSMIDPTPSAKDTDQIIRLIGGAHMTDALALRMYGGSVAQTAGAGGDTKYSGLDVQVTTPNAATVPVLFQYDTSTGAEALITNKWSTAWNPDSIAGAVRVLVKTREYGVDIDGRRVRGALLELGDNYFFGGTTLGDATTSLALFSSSDGNDDESGAAHSTVVFTDGYQELNYNNGNGLTPYGLSVDFGSETSIQTYQRTKYVQRRGTAESLFGLNGQLVLGMNRNFAHDGETAALTENQVMAWGTIVAYDGQTVNLTLGEAISFSGGAKGRILMMDDDGATGTLIVEVTEGTSIGDDETITGEDSGGDGVVNDVGGVDVIESRSGIGWLVAYDDDGTTGNVYYQAQAGLDPVDDQPIYQIIGGVVQNVVVNGAVSTRTINNQFVGIYTGSNFQTNFGIGIDPSDAILGDLNRNLLDVNQGVPDNQQGVVGNTRAGDRITCYPWDGTTTDANGDAVPDTDEMTVATTALTGAAVASVEVNAIPDNTPASGQLRITRNSGVVTLHPYSSFSGTTFTFTTTQDFSSDNVNIGNGVMRAFIDTTEDTGTDGSPGSESFTAVKGAGNTQMTVTVRRGDNTPIVPYKANPIFGATGFSVDAIRNSDA
jgi:hypothetical protein